MVQEVVVITAEWKEKDETTLNQQRSKTSTTNSAHIHTHFLSEWERNTLHNCNLIETEIHFATWRIKSIYAILTQLFGCYCFSEATKHTQTHTITATNSTKQKSTFPVGEENADSDSTHSERDYARSRRQGRKQPAMLNTQNRLLLFPASITKQKRCSRLKVDPCRQPTQREGPGRLRTRSVLLPTNKYYSTRGIPTIPEKSRVRRPNQREGSVAHNSAIVDLAENSTLYLSLLYHLRTHFHAAIIDRMDLR